MHNSRRVDTRSETTHQPELTNLVFEQSEQAAKIGSFVFELAPRKLVWSRGMHRIYETDPDAFVPHAESSAPFDTLEHTLTLLHAAHTREASDSDYDAELEVVSARGNHIWVHLVCREETNAAGRRRIVGSLQDITAYRKAEEALRASERFVHSTLDALSAHLAIVDSSGTIIAVNAAWRRFAEANAAAADNMSEGINYLSVCDAAAERKAPGAADFASGIRAVMKGTLESYTQEYECHSPSKQRWFIGSVTPFAISGTGYLVIAHENITERKLAEAAHIESLRRFESVSNEAPVMIWMTHTSMRSTFFNKAWLEFKGRSMEEEISRGWERDVHPEDLRQCYATYRAAVLRREKFRIEYRMRRHDGAYRWLLSSGSPRYSADNVFEGYIGSCIDITERKKMEAEIRILSHVVEQSPAMILITDLKGGIEYVNPAFTRILGYSLEEARGQSPVIFRADAMSSADYQKLQGRILSGSTLSTEERVRRKNGDPIWMAVVFSPVTDTDGRVTHVAAIGIDITEHKHTEAALKQLNVDLRQLSDNLNTIRENERTMIAREVHDELGQVFTALKLELMMLLQTASAISSELPPRTYSIMQMIESGIKTVQHISSSLRPRILDDLGLISAIEWEAEQFQKRTGIRVGLALPDEEVAIEKDIATAVFRIIQESLTNIMRHAEATEVAIGLQLTETELAFTVRDNGKGIAEAKLADSESLGLIGIRERIRMLGGGIEFLNNAGGGMSVSAHVPLHQSLSNKS